MGVTAILPFKYLSSKNNAIIIIAIAASVFLALTKIISLYARSFKFTICSVDQFVNN
ncbi:hypothetical protein GCM10022271_10610 [Corallibacter vietnamensis]|uniref:Uncharacterized protein n=1 Tax=Corallibacter vietnamensis TaxID=904130 RepID=A0ABP7H7B5_9FLAO